MNPRRAEELKLAFMLLTRLPVSPIPGEPPAMFASSWAWPIVGLVVGLVSAITCRVAMGFDLPPLMVAIVALAAGALVTGAMHEDGLADVADGFGGGRTVERKLEIMRDSRIGSYGVVALVLSLGFRAAGIAAVASSGTTLFALVAVAAASRAALPMALHLMPPARADGLGRSAAGVDPVPATIAVSIGFLCLLPLGPGAAVGIAFSMALTAFAVGLLAMRQIGGQSGDVLGAMQQAAECAGWACLVAIV